LEIETVTIKAQSVTNGQDAITFRKDGSFEATAGGGTVTETETHVQTDSDSGMLRVKKP
jgi:hypothetical protein